MNICQHHWDMLRAEVAAQGLTDWVAPDGETAAAQIGNQLVRDEDTRVNYDPLMACNFMLWDRALEMAGPAAMAADFGCPICRFSEYRGPEGQCTCGHPDCPNQEPGSVPDFETWLVGPNSCVAAARDYMVTQGWIE
jgi:hypothetical protein